MESGADSGKGDAVTRGNLALLLERHRAFWDGCSGVLLEAVRPYVPPPGDPQARSGTARLGLPLADGTRSVEGQEITPALIDPALFLRDQRRPEQPVRGDFLVGTAPPHLCWTEAMIGCSVRYIKGGPWAEPAGVDWRRPQRVVSDGRWLAKLDDFVRLLVQRAQGRYPVTQPLMRGPVDMMAAAVGHEATCLALTDEPLAAEAFLARCAEIFVETARRRLTGTPRFADGYLSAYGIWAPVAVVRTQMDNATMLSPPLYRNHVLRHDQSIIEAFGCALVHLHSGCLHLVDALLGLDSLQAVQVSIDYPGGPLATQVLPMLERIVRRKPLIVTGPVTPAELAALRALGRWGSLCLQVRLLPG